MVAYKIPASPYLETNKVVYATQPGIYVMYYNVNTTQGHALLSKFQVELV